MRRGDTVCVVGEWSGDTGDAELEKQLRRSFRLTRRLALPNWTDTVHELTIWQRAPCRGESAPDGDDHSPMACSGCGTGCSGGITTRREGLEDIPAIRSGERPLRRCRYCREVAYCSVACAEADSGRHAEVHATRLIFFRDHVPAFDSDADYAAIQ